MKMEARTQEALAYLRVFPEAKIRHVAREFGVSRDRLRRRMQGIGPLESRLVTNTKLTAPEEVALCRYIDRLDAINLAVKPVFVTDAANYVLACRASPAKQHDPPVVGNNWTTRFLKRHGYHKRHQRKLQKDRSEAEKPDVVADYFAKLHAIIQEHGIVPEDIWNMDETGFRIGVGKDQFIVTKRKRAHYFALPENRESAIQALPCAGPGCDGPRRPNQHHEG